jgi:methionyl-tRNA formyltransferase
MCLARRHGWRILWWGMMKGTEVKRIGLLSTLDAPFLGYIIRECTNSDVPVSAVILDSKMQNARDHRIHEERTAGRLPPLSLNEFQSLGIPFYFVWDHSSTLTAGLVQKLGLDLLVNAGTPRILGKDILEAPSLGIVNCHPGLLPGYRGCTCVEWAIYFDEQVGNTIHFMNERIDEGPIVLQEGLVFKKSDTYVDVRVKVYEHANELLARGVLKIMKERLCPSILPAQGLGRYFGVIEPEKMQMVLEKLSHGAYAFQE